MLNRSFGSLIALLLVALFDSAQAGDQATAARGFLECFGSRLSGLLVELYDADWPDPDDLMGKAWTDHKGQIQVEGFTDSFSQIKPYLKIHHNCSMTNELICTKLIVPADYIVKGQRPGPIFDFGEFDLEGRPGDC